MLTQACDRRGTSPSGRTAAGEVLGLTIDQHRFCVIGPGRLGSTVLAGLLEARLTVTAVGVHADDDTSLFDFVPHVRVRDAALEADAWWLAVPDDEISRRGRQARRGSAGHAPRRGAPAARHPLQRPGLGAPAQAALRAGRARPVPAPAADVRRRAGRQAAAGRPLRGHRARGARPAARRGARRPPRHAALPPGRRAEDPLSPLGRGRLQPAGGARERGQAPDGRRPPARHAAWTTSRCCSRRR